MAEVAHQFHAFSFPSNTTSDLTYPDVTHDQYPNDHFHFPTSSPSYDQTSSADSDQCLSSFSTTHPNFRASTPNEARSPPPLPAFSFNSSTHANVPEDGTLPLPTTNPATSAPTSPTSFPTSQRRHRRTVSELKGGAEGQATSAAVRRASTDQAFFAIRRVSTDQALAGAQPIDLGSPPPRRGHRHRRSGIFASQDFDSSTSTQNFRGTSHTPERARTSEPWYNSPTAPALFPAWTFPNANAGPGASSNLQENSNHDPPQTPSRSPSRARVGFSDTVEVIPRPTSLISYDSGSSVSTPRETSGGISRALSGTRGSPLAMTNGCRKSVVFDDQPTRPRSASPVMRARLLRFASDKNDTVPRRPTSAGASPRSRSRLSKSTSIDLAHSQSDLEGPSPWTRAFGSNAQMSTPTTPTKTPSSNEDVFDLDTAGDEGQSCRTSADLSENFDEDPTSILVTGQPRFEIPSWKPSPSSGESAFRETTSPMIDLDAALDTTVAFTPDSRSSKGRSFSAARQSMHSSNLASGFFGVGMQYHRRAESEPSVIRRDSDLTPSGRRQSAGHDQIFEMENVFEEDEEDGLVATFKAAPSVDTAAVSHVVVVDGEYIDSNQVTGYDSLADPFVETDLAKTHDIRDFILHQPQFNSGSQPQPPQSDTDSYADARRSVGATSLDIRHSVDDVPSLMSSGSTMTDAVQAPVPSIISSRALSRSTASSLCMPVNADTAAEEKRHKRSSIASFSRFIGSPFASSTEKSNVAAERERRQTLDMNRPAKHAKGSRLSRFLRFLKA